MDVECQNCHGTGKVTPLASDMNEYLLGTEWAEILNSPETCGVCDGTGRVSPYPRKRKRERGDV